MLSSGWDGGPVRPAFIMATLGHDHADHWASGPNGERGKEYAELKQKTARTFIDRLAQRLPKGFRDAIRFSVPGNTAHPGALHRQPRGIVHGVPLPGPGNMGGFSRRPPQSKGSTLPGSRVFPGFGVAGVAASGYYCAKTVLGKAGIDLLAVMA